MTQSAYEDSYHKIVRVDELAFGTPRKFRAAGSEINIRRDESGITATDGDGVALPTRIDNGELWVCIEQCQSPFNRRDPC